MVAAKDPGKNHFYISMAKSAIRIIAGGLLMAGMFVAAGSLFIVAEALGIAEEMV